MTATIAASPRKPARTTADGPYHVQHPSFEQSEAARLYGPKAPEVEEVAGSYMLDEVTREYARRMHYAAYRSAKASDSASKSRWRLRYYSFRDRIVLGNRKLVFRAVRRWSPAPALADDLISDCQIVLIQAVSAYNPWMGIRFSTYAFTCLMRALSRLSQRHANDRLARSLPLDALPDGEPRDADTEESPNARMHRVDEYLRDSHELLSTREKRVLRRRFSLAEEAKQGTLEEVGRELGLSKERVRQVQATALGKLRKALLEGSSAS